MRNEFAAELVDRVNRDSSIHLITCDLGYGVLDSFAKTHPNNYLNLGITEQASMSIAAGLAARGLRPFLYSIANFPTFRCLEQIRNDVCAMALPVTIVSVGAGLGYGKAGYSHFAVEDISALRSLDIDIYNPSDSLELHECIEAILTRDRPAYLRLGGKQNYSKDLSIFENSSAVSADITIAYTGDLKTMVLTAADNIEKQGFNVHVASFPVISQEKVDEFLDSKPTLVLSVEEHVLSGGFSSLLLERINDLGMVTRVERIGIRDLNPHLVGSQQFLQTHYGLTAVNIAERALRKLGKSS